MDLTPWVFYCPFRPDHFNGNSLHDLLLHTIQHREEAFKSH